MKVGCVAIVKNEERHIAEWLAWQFLVGFDTVFLLDNASTDATAAIARRMAQRFDIQVFDYPSDQADRQVAGYEQVVRAVGAGYEWLAFFDTDEFLVLDEGLSLKALLARRPEAAVAIPWAIFGSSGHEDMSDDLVIEAFRRRAPADFPPNRHVKSIIRPTLAVRAISPHVWQMRGATVDLMGRPLSWESPLGLMDSAPDYAGGKVHHYFTRSRAHWRARLARGNISSPRTPEDFDQYDRNEIADDSAARRAPALRALLATPAPEPPMSTTMPSSATPAPRLGIAITTFNRREMVCAQVERLRGLTSTPHELVVCDDGSTDGTVEALRALGVTVIAGANRGIAWNKNRGLYYLLHIARCDVILLLDDDVEPVQAGWEREWIEAVQCYGHVNHTHPAYKESVAAGAGTGASPALAAMVPGWVLGFTRQVLGQVGYFDQRFGRYGHEHSDLSVRVARAGFGGITVGPPMHEVTLFYAIEGGLRGVPSVTWGTLEELEVNGGLLAQSSREPLYRHAWRNDAERVQLLDEIAAALPPAEVQALRPHNRYASLAAYLEQHDGVPPGLISRHKPATLCALAPGTHRTSLQAAAGAVNGVIDGTAKFHTPEQANPWWQVDLGGIATIREIRVHNVTGPEAARLANFLLAVSIDGTVWVELMRKADGVPVQGAFVWNGPGTAWARFVRVMMVGPGVLSLDQVEVFGDLP